MATTQNNAAHKGFDSQVMSNPLHVFRVRAKIAAAIQDSVGSPIAGFLHASIRMHAAKHGLVLTSAMHLEGTGCLCNNDFPAGDVLNV